MGRLWAHNKHIRIFLISFSQGISTTLMISRFFAQIASESGDVTPVNRSQSRSPPHARIMSPSLETRSPADTTVAVPRDMTNKNMDIVGGGGSLAEAILSSQDRQGAQ